MVYDAVMSTEEHMRFTATLTLNGLAWTSKETGVGDKRVIVRARRTAGAHFVPLVGRYVTPDHIEAEVVFAERLLVEMAIEVVDGRPGVRRVAMSRPDGRALHAAETRLPLRQLMSEALELVAGEFRISADGVPSVVAVALSSDWPGASNRFLAAAGRATRSEVDDGRLREVARVHAAAPPRGRIAAVAAHEKCGTRYAQTLIRRARERGLIQKEKSS